MPTDRACDCGAPRCERDGCQDKPTTDRAQDTEAIRAALEAGRHEAEGLDGTDFNPTKWNVAEAALGRLVARLEAAEREHRDLREILKAWGLGDADKMVVLMLGAFLREFGEAPALAAAAPGETEQTP